MFRDARFRRRQRHRRNLSVSRIIGRDRGLIEDVHRYGEMMIILMPKREVDARRRPWVWRFENKLWKILSYRRRFRRCHSILYCYYLLWWLFARWAISGQDLMIAEYDIYEASAISGFYSPRLFFHFLARANTGILQFQAATKCPNFHQSAATPQGPTVTKRKDVFKNEGSYMTRAMYDAPSKMICRAVILWHRRQSEVTYR